MENPFAVLERRINRLEALLEGIDSKITPPHTRHSLSVDTLIEYAFERHGTRISKASVYNSANRGQLRYRKRGGKLVFEVEDADDWLSGRPVKTATERADAALKGGRRS